jgi:hypothetical protein
VVKSACDKGVKIFAYDAWLVDKLGGKGNIVVITGVPGTSVDTLRTKAAKEVFAKHPGIKIVAESVGMWSQAVARTEMSKILATQNWDHIDGLWMQVGCYTANAMQLEAGKKASQLLPCAGEGSNGGRIQMLPAGTEVEGATSPYMPLGAPRISYASPPYSGGPCAQARSGSIGRQERSQDDDPAAAARDKRHNQIMPGRHLAGNEGRLQRVQTFDRAEPGMVRVDLLGADAGDRSFRRFGGSA